MGYLDCPDDSGTQAKSEIVSFSELGKSGAEKRHRPMRDLRTWATEQYQAGQWQSANQAAHQLQDRAIAHGRTIGAHLTETNAQRTLADWFRKSA